MVIASSVGGCSGSGVQDGAADGSEAVSAKGRTLEHTMFEGFPSLHDEDLWSALESQYGESRGALARIGKVQVRLWLPESDAARSGHPGFLTPASVSLLQSQFRAAVAETTGTRPAKPLAYKFIGCDTTAALRSFGKPDLDPGADATKACGFLMDRPPEGRLRQLEFVVVGNHQYVYVTTDIFQRPAVFQATTPLKPEVVVLARPDSWQDEIQLFGVKSGPLDMRKPHEAQQAEIMKQALHLFHAPTGLADASDRWYGIQVNIKGREVVLGATAAAALGVSGMSELFAGLGAMDAAATGTLAASGDAAVSGAAATATTNTYAMVGGAWHATAGFFLAASSGADLLQTQHVISLEPNPAKRARLQFAFTLFKRTAQIIGAANFVVTKAPLVRALARNYMKSRIFLTLGAQKADFDKEAAALVVGSLKTEATNVHGETIDLFHDLRGIATDSEDGFLGKVSAMVKRAADHGALVRASGQNVADAHKLAGEIALRGPKWYVNLMNTLTDEQMMKLERMLAATTTADAGMLNAVRQACDEAAVETAVKFYRRVFAPEPPRH